MSGSTWAQAAYAHLGCGGAVTGCQRGGRPGTESSAQAPSLPLERRLGGCTQLCVGSHASWSSTVDSGTQWLPHANSSWRLVARGPRMGQLTPRTCIQHSPRLPLLSLVTHHCWDLLILPQPQSSPQILTEESRSASQLSDFNTSEHNGQRAGTLGAGLVRGWVGSPKPHRAAEPPPGEPQKHSNCTCRPLPFVLVCNHTQQCSGPQAVLDSGWSSSNVLPAALGQTRFLHF